MPANTFITSDQSNTPIAPPLPSGTSTGGVNSGNNPQDIIKPIAGAGGSGPILVYPSDRPKYYMQFDIYKYTRATLMSVGTLGSALSTIVMPLSANTNDATSVNWQDTPVGLGAFAYDQAATALRGINVSSLHNLGELSDAIARASTAAGLGVAGATVSTSAAVASFLGWEASSTLVGPSWASRLISL
jgi:hypothetical protein